MTTTPPYPAHGSGLSPRGLMLSEWIKLTSLRSTIWCYGIIVVINLGLSLLLALSFRSPGAGTTALNQGYWVQSATIGVAFSQLVIAVLGALVITGEYGTGMIRSTFAAVPKRLPALIAKAAVFGLTTLGISLVTLVGGALIAAPILNSAGLGPDLTDLRAWGAIVGGAGYLTLVGLISLFLGTIVRNSAAGISAALGLIFVAPIVLQIFAAVTRAAWAVNLLELLPSSAGARLYGYSETPVPGISGVIVLDPGQGLLVLVAWVLLFGIGASVLLTRRDA